MPEPPWYRRLWTWLGHLSTAVTLLQLLAAAGVSGLVTALFESMQWTTGSVSFLVFGVAMLLASSGLAVLRRRGAKKSTRQSKQSGDVRKHDEMLEVTKRASISPSRVSVEANLSDAPLVAALRFQLKAGEEMLHSLSFHNPIAAAARGGPIPATTEQVDRWESLTGDLLTDHLRLQAQFLMEQPSPTLAQLSTYNLLYHRLEWRLNRLDLVIRKLRGR